MDQFSVSDISTMTKHRHKINNNITSKDSKGLFAICTNIDSTGASVVQSSLSAVKGIRRNKINNKDKHDTHYKPLLLCYEQYCIVCIYAAVS